MFRTQTLKSPLTSFLILKSLTLVSYILENSVAQFWVQIQNRENRLKLLTVLPAIYITSTVLIRDHIFFCFCIFAGSQAAVIVIKFLSI